VPLPHLIPMAVDLPTNIVGWLGMIVIFSVAIIIHELGHLLWAKKFGIGAEEFAIGFGKRVFSFERGGTIYSVRALPLGGFVKIKGMIAALEEEQQEKERQEELAKGGLTKNLVRSAAYESSLAMKDLPLWKRLIVFAGGVVNNVVLGFFLFWILAGLVGVPVERIPDTVGWVASGSSAQAAGFAPGDKILSVNGKPTEDFLEAVALVLKNKEGPSQVEIRRGDRTLTLTWSIPESEHEKFRLDDEMLWTQPPTIMMLMPNQPAERAGLKVGDTVIAVDGHPVSHWMDMQPYFTATEGKRPVTLTVRRGDQTLDVDVTPEYWPSLGHYTIGFFPGDPNARPERLGLWGSLDYSISKITDICVGTLVLLGKILTFQMTAAEVSGQLGGPIAIGIMSYQAATQGLSQFLFIAGALNIALAILNILPIPILDGGHCLINIIESVRRRPIPLRVLERVYTIFLALIVALAATLITKDIVSNWWRLSG
jgi:regulator of sigma E protease